MRFYYKIVRNIYLNKCIYDNVFRWRRVFMIEINVLSCVGIILIFY